MSLTSELDLAIEQIDDLLSKLQARAPQATGSPANEPNTNSKHPAAALEMQHRWTTCQRMSAAYRREWANKASRPKVSRCAVYTKQWQSSCDFEQ